MTRKSISTNAPVTSCDVCGRTLLRGEQADVFLHGGARRNVCELCTQRASHEGWIREGLDGATVRGGQNGGGRSRSLLGRLRSRREAAQALAAEEPEARPAPDPVLPPEPPRSVHAVPTNADLKLARAIDIFNASQYPRTIAGVARSLGAPVVAARPSAYEGSIVTIVVSWELSWYRYEVDLADEAAGPRQTGQGTELDELDPADLVPNTASDDTGMLHVVAQPA